MLPEAKLPIEVADFSVTNNYIGWRIMGTMKTQTIELELLVTRDKKSTKTNEIGITNKSRNT